MKRIQQSIDIGVPAHIAYNQLMQFEEYPRFMQDVEAVDRIDDTHLHWTTKMSNREVEWDAAITEQVQDRCIAWHNTSGPTISGKVEVQAAGPDLSRVTMTLESEPDQIPGSPVGNSDTDIAQRLGQDLQRLKQLIETRGSGNAQKSQTAGAPLQTSGFAAGSEGWDGTEDPAEPVVSSARSTAHQSDQMPSQQQPSPSAATTQSDYSLSQSPESEADEQRFSVAEEVSLDQQSDQARRVGQMPLDLGIGGEANPSADMAKSMKQDESQAEEKKAKEEKQLKDSIDRATPPSA